MLSRHDIAVLKIALPKPSPEAPRLLTGMFKSSQSCGSQTSWWGASWG